MIRVENKLILEYGCGVDFITVSIFDLLHHNEVMLVDVGDEGGLV
jgi:hypothetical protein